jgi:hypothetical protein
MTQTEGANEVSWGYWGNKMNMVNMEERIVGDHQRQILRDKQSLYSK